MYVCMYTYVYTYCRCIYVCVCVCVCAYWDRAQSLVDQHLLIDKEAKLLAQYSGITYSYITTHITYYCITTHITLHIFRIVCVCVCVYMMEQSRRRLNSSLRTLL